jgi:heterodisulfide reductase subunit A-like polyferredoxin
VIPLLGTCPKEHKSDYNRDTCIPMFITAQFTIAKLGNNTNALQLMNESRKYGIYIMEFYSDRRKNDTMWLEKNKWMQLEDIMLSN